MRTTTVVIIAATVFIYAHFNRHLHDNTFLDKPHSHDFFIVLLITSGGGTHTIDFKQYAVNRGSVFFVTPGQVHHWALSPDIDGYILFFTKEYFLLDFDLHTLFRLPYFYSSINPPLLQLSDEDTKHASAIFGRIAGEYDLRKDKFHTMIRLHLAMLLIDLERRYSTVKPSPYNLMRYQENLIHKFETLIDNHYKDHLMISEYASRMNISLKQLSAVCKRALNKTPGDLVQERIMLEAKRLLIHFDFSVSLVAQVLNYIDTSYFIRVFKKVTGMTREQFRLKDMSY